MGIQILNKDVSVISNIMVTPKTSIGSIFGTTGWAGGGVVTPSPTPNWPNPSNDSSGTTTTIGQQIQSITTTITLQISWTGTNAAASSQGLYIAVNTSNSYGGTIYTVQNGFNTPTTGTYSFTVNPNEWVFFRVTTSNSVTRNLTITNTSDSAVTLDTVTLTSDNL
jgi:hypothetical protein